MTGPEPETFKYRGKRYSFGYPACPNLDDQQGLFNLLKPEDIGVRLTEGMMMEPEASVSDDADLISHVRLRDGTLEWDTVEWDRLVDCFPAGDLVIQFSGPAVTAWTLNGSGDAVNSVSPPGGQATNVTTLRAICSM